MKKNKLLQDLVAQSPSNGKVTRAHKEAALIITLKQRIKELEGMCKSHKNANEIIKKNINITKQTELEDSCKAYEEECNRLRLMIKKLITDKYKGAKSVNSEEVEKVNISLRVTVEQKDRQIEDLKKQLEEFANREKQRAEQIKKHKQQQKNYAKSKEKITQQELVIDEQQTKIALLINQVKKLEIKLADEGGNSDSQGQRADTISNLNAEITKLKTDKDNLKGKLLVKEKEFLEMQKEFRDEKARLKEREEAYTLKALEDKEKLTERLVTLERELHVRDNKNVNIPKEIAVPLIRESDLKYTKELFKVILINSKKSFDFLKDELFCEYKLDEPISIKEFIKLVQKNPLCLEMGQAEDLARYLIEPRDKQIVVYNKYTERSVEQVRIKLNEFLNLEYPKDYWQNIDSITKGAIEKVKERFKYMNDSVKEIIAEHGRLEFVKWIQVANSVCPELNTMEKDCLIALMTGKDNDLKELKFSVIY